MSQANDFQVLSPTIKEIATRKLVDHMSDKYYEETSANGWSTTIISEILEDLGETESEWFRFLVSCTIISKEMSTAHTMGMALWDKDNDGSVSVDWENESMRCCVTVWGIKVGCFM